MAPSVSAMPAAAPSPQAAIAAMLFTHLSSKNVAHAVLGDVESDVIELRGDVDIVVGRDELPRAPALLLDFCETSGLRIVQMLQHEQTANYFVLADRTNTPEPAFLAVDFCSDFVRHGRLLLRADELLEPPPTPVKLSSGIQILVPTAATAFIYYLLKKIDKGELDDRHASYLTDRWRRDPEGADDQVLRFWDGVHRDWIVAAAERGEWGALRSRLSALRAALHARAPRTFTGAFGEGKRLLGRMLRPTGLFVCFLGSDGSGKSTVLRHVSRGLAPAFRHTQRFHLRPRFGSEKAAPAVRDPHAARPRGPVLSVLKLAYWLADYTLGYALVVPSRLVGSTLVLFDRYYVDLCVDPIRYRYGGPMGLARLVGKLVPQPHVMILLDAPPREARARKPELSIDVLTRQRNAYRDLVRAYGGSIVDAGRPLSHVLGQVNGIVLDHMAARTARRLRLEGLSKAGGSR